MLKRVQAGVLSVAYEESGTANGTPVLLLHGFPYDVHAYDDVTPLLVEAGCRVIVPYLRGYGPTSFLAQDTPRSGQQAALGHDLLAFMDALQIQRGVLAGYDWGGRAACIVAALWPERVSGLVTGGGYNIQHIPRAMQPQSPAIEHQLWYQYYFHGERGRVGLEQNRHELCKFIWRLWSPGWQFDEATYDRTAASFDNPDFVAVVIHSYRHRFSLEAGDQAVEATERRLTVRPPIQVPTVVLHGGNSGLTLVTSPEQDQQLFTGACVRRWIPTAGHNLPQEAPRDFAAAVLTIVHGF